MSEHHPDFAPSSIGRVKACPPSMKLSRQVARVDRPSSGAERGTRLHEAALQPGDTGDLSAYDQDAVEWVRERIAIETEGADEVHVEERVSVGELTWGTADLIWRRGTEAGVIDAKFHPTGEPPMSMLTEQGRAYALGVLERWPDVEVVYVAFVAPHGDREIRFAVTRRNSPEHSDDLFWTWDMAEHHADPDDVSQYCVGEHCHYCPAIRCCRAIQEVAGVA